MIRNDKWIFYDIFVNILGLLDVPNQFVEISSIIFGIEFEDFVGCT
jgi:hypothetical protein